MMMDYIAQALVLLMRSKPYAGISIGEITAKAGVNRATYYRHFTTKESVIHFYLDAIMREYQNKYVAQGITAHDEYLRVMFETFYEKKEDLLLIHEAGLSFILLDVLMKQFRFSQIPEAEQFRASYHIGGIYNNLCLWFDHKMNESPERMKELALLYGPKESLLLDLLE